jgi:type IV pilus assembly protein PilQ
MASQITSTTTGGGGTGSKGKWAQEEETGITRVVKKLLSEHGSIIEDFRTNSLIITDIPSRMPIIEQTIALLDVPAPQVMLEVEMLDVSKNVVDQLGFDFGTSPITLILPGGFARRGAEAFIGTLGDRKLHISDSTAAGKVVLGSTFGELLHFLSTRSDTKYLARPRLLTLNNETAEIKITTQEAIGVTTITEATTGTTTATPERTETGVTLRVTPQINLETGEITMFIYPRVSEATAGNSFTSGNATYQFRDPEERSTKNLVRIKDGETVIVGGLIRNEYSVRRQKIPILGDLPLIGFLFRHKGPLSGETSPDKNKERELLVFITPHIIKDTNIELALGEKKVSLLAREQDRFLGTNRQAAIAATLNNFEKKKK